MSGPGSFFARTCVYLIKLHNYHRMRIPLGRAGLFLVFFAWRYALFLLLPILGLLRVYHTSEINQKVRLSDSKEDDYLLTKRQSLGFFDDVASSQWQRMQKKIVGMSKIFASIRWHLIADHHFGSATTNPILFARAKKELEGAAMAENGSVTHIARQKNNRSRRKLPYL